MSGKKVSGKTHTKEQLDSWANQNNPNNKAYRSNANNHANQLNPNRFTTLTVGIKIKSGPNGHPTTRNMMIKKENQNEQTFL